MQSTVWPDINKGIEQHLAKTYTDNKSTLKKEYWVLKLTGRNAARAAQNAKNQAKSKVICRQGSRSVVVLQDMQMESSKTREYPSLIRTFYDTHIADSVWLQDEARLQYEEMLRLKDLGPNTPSVVPYTEDEIMAKVRAGKQRRHIPGVGRALAGRARDVLTINEPRCMHTADKDEVKALRKETNLLMKVVRSGDKMSQLLTQLQSQHEVGSGSESDGGGDDEYLILTMHV
ncbi:hypothetical protein Tco_0008720 [Tanacetum coccineum]